MALDAPASQAKVVLLFALLGTGCGGESGGGPAIGGGGANHDAAVDPPLDAGLLPGAKLEDCVSDDGVRICGYAAGCYEPGPPCDCNTSGPDDTVPDISVCRREPLSRGGGAPCGYCRDGDVCLSGAHPVSVSRIAFCVSESLGRLYWMHGAGDRVTYADSTPYTGEPVPRPTQCPPPIGNVVLCGGYCGGCGGGDQIGSRVSYCSGRSPTHPWGICVEYGSHCYQASDCSPDEACLLLTTGPPWPPGQYPTRCVNSADCPLLARSIPGGAQCN
jgi:hypothetical protein